MMQYCRSLWLVLALVCVLLASCGGEGTSVSGTPTPSPTPEELLNLISTATQEAESLSFAIDFRGAPVYADPVSEQFAIISVEGQLRRPNAARATVRVRNVATIAEIRLVSLEGQMYATNPVTREWQCFPSGALFDPVVLFDPERGVDYLIREELTDVTFEGVEDFADTGRPHYYLTGSFPSEPLRDISYGLIGRGDVAVELWADVETQRVAQLVLIDSGTDESGATTWVMDVSSYNQDVDIRAPLECP